MTETDADRSRYPQCMRRWLPALSSFALAVSTAGLLAALAASPPRVALSLVAFLIGLATWISVRLPGPQPPERETPL